CRGPRVDAPEELVERQARENEHRHAVELADDRRAKQALRGAHVIGRGERVALDEQDAGYVEVGEGRGGTGQDVQQPGAAGQIPGRIHARESYAAIGPARRRLRRNATAADEARRGPTNGVMGLHPAEDVKVAAAHRQHLVATLQVDTGGVVVAARDVV